MSKTFRRSLSPWLDAARKVGAFFLLLAVSAGLGFLIAWPLWLFATTQRGLYTISVLSLLAAGIVFLAARGIVRRRNAVRDPGKPRKAVLSIVIGFFMGILGLAGAYTGAALIVHGMWKIGVPTLLLVAVLLWLLGLARRALKNRKEAPIPAENRGE